jgi:L-ascorbate 6-phosphate lactonase
MFKNLENIRNYGCPAGKVIIHWLGGAGFVFKFANGQIICIDPYLSDFAERMHNDGTFRRITLAPVTPDKIRFDAILFSHEHGDHMDVDAFDEMSAANKAAAIFAPVCCAEFLDSKGVGWTKVAPGQSLKFGEITIDVVDCNHGDDSPDAVAFLIKFDGRTVYFVGDSCFDRKIMQPIADTQPDILLPPINGAYGNLNEKEAANLAKMCNSKFVIPCHFGLFMEHGGCPRRFAEALAETAPGAQIVVLTPGRGIEI